MRSKSVKPSLYPKSPFYSIHTISLFSSAIVAIILAVFIYNLHTASKRLPWTFLVLLITSGLSIINYFFLTLINCGYALAPRLSLTFNGICLTLWLVSLGLLSWSLYQTILTTCTATYWVTSTGITVCRIYKVLFTFTVLATAGSIAAVILDIIIRNRQTRLGDYDPMASNPMLDASGGVRLQDHGVGHAHSDSQGGSPTPPDYYAPPPDPVHGGRGAPLPTHGSQDPLEQYHAGEAQDYYEAAPVRGRRPGPRVRFSAAQDYNGYNHPPEQTSYDPAAYR